MRPNFLIPILLGLCTFAGCQQRIATSLLGKWEGVPDTAAARQSREAEKYGDKSDPGAPESKAKPPTDWEAYDIRVVLDFVSRSDVKLSLDNGSQPVEGTWNMVQAGPVACTIEIETQTAEDGGAELRRYKLELDERDGQLYGFIMTELGADRGLGALYFRRADN